MSDGANGSWQARLREDAALLATAAIGGLALHLAGLPAGWLTGAMLLVGIVALRRPWQGPAPMTVQAGMLLSGVIIGAAATPEAVQAVVRYPGSIALLLLSMVTTIVVTSLVLIRFGGWTRLDAVLASAPGALSAVMAVAIDRQAGTARIAIVQFFRLFVLVAALPSLLVFAGAGGVSVSPVAVQPGWRDTAIMLGAGLAAGLVFRRIGVVAPMILGATLASAVLHAFDLVHGTLPMPLTILAFVILGGMIGARLGGLDRVALAKLLPLALLAFVASITVAALLAWPAALLAKVSYGAAFVAFAPGGIEAMAMVAVVMGYDPLYVGAHHLVRFMAVGLLLPVLVGKVEGRPGRDTELD